MKLVKPHPKIYLFLGDSPADLGRPFVRLAEYFESPSKLFYRRYFTLAAFKKWYARTQSPSGTFSYYRDFFGYNIPGDVAMNFFTLYAERMTVDELNLLKMLGDTPRDFYLIGAPAKSAATVDHELHHAMFHLFPDYRKMMIGLLAGENLAGVRRFLKSAMYRRDVFADESCAYLMFDDAMLHRNGVSTRHLRGVRGGMLGVYRAYKDKNIRL